MLPSILDLNEFTLKTILSGFRAKIQKIARLAVARGINTLGSLLTFLASNEFYDWSYFGVLAIR